MSWIFFLPVFGALEPLPGLESVTKPQGLWSSASDLLFWLLLKRHKANYVCFKIYFIYIWFLKEKIVKISSRNQVYCQGQGQDKKEGHRQGQCQCLIQCQGQVKGQVHDEGQVQARDQAQGREQYLLNKMCKLRCNTFAEIHNFSWRNCDVPCLFFRTKR